MKNGKAKVKREGRENRSRSRKVSTSAYTAANQSLTTMAFDREGYAAKEGRK